MYILGEDLERVRPLLEELDSRGVPTVVWDTSSGALIPTKGPPRDAVFYCRQSPSAGSRFHPHSMEYAKTLLRWLEFHGAKVINGSRALDAEASKALQAMYLHAAGLNTPFCVMTQGRGVAAAESTRFSGPLIAKPNEGGSGGGVSAYESSKQMRAQFKHARLPDTAPHDLWILQDLLGEHSDDPTVVKTILRFEVMGGRVQRDYVVKISAPATEFSLCPCDPRFEVLMSSISFKILRDPHTIPGLDLPGALDNFCGKVELAFQMAGALIGSIEAMVLLDRFPEQAAEYPHPHEPVVFDMNFNTNFNERAERAAGIRPGIQRMADCIMQVAAEAPAHGAACTTFDRDRDETDTDPVLPTEDDADSLAEDGPSSSSSPSQSSSSLCSSLSSNLSSGGSDCGSCSE